MPLVQRLRPFTQTIFAEMSALAADTGAINLGQGFPDSDGPPEMLAAATTAITSGCNQYPPGPGIVELRQAIAAVRLADYGQVLDPADEVLVTAGATEAIAAAVLSLCEAGDEVLMLEPFYDSYPAVVAMAGGVAKTVPLRANESGRASLDLAEFEAAVGPKTRLLILNSPHNPTGTVLDSTELAGIARICQERNIIVISDEVYEYLTFDGVVHTPIASYPGMSERTITVSSAGKSFSATGWKIGWACGPAGLIAAVRTAKQYLTFVSGGPFQPAVALALRTQQPWARQLALDLQHKRDRLSAGLQSVGLQVWRPQGTYFVIADIRSIGEADGMEFCRQLPHRAGVVAAPAQVFYQRPSDWRHLVRFAFCKSDQVIDQACDQLARLAAI